MPMPILHACSFPSNKLHPHQPIRINVSEMYVDRSSDQFFGELLTLLGTGFYLSIHSKIYKQEVERSHRWVWIWSSMKEQFWKHVEDCRYSLKLAQNKVRNNLFNFIKEKKQKSTPYHAPWLNNKNLFYTFQTQGKELFSS